MVPVRFAIDLQLHVQIKQTENRIGRRAQPAAGGHLCRTGMQPLELEAARANVEGHD